MKRIYSLQEESLENEYADVKASSMKSKLILMPLPLSTLPVGFQLHFASRLKRNFREWKIWE